MLRRFVCLLFLLFVGAISFAQTPNNFAHLSLQFDEGNSVVTHAVEDSLGFVWLAHGNGISRFDGYTYHFISKDSIFGPKDKYNYVKRLFKDSSGILWALSENGQLSYLKENTNFFPIDERIKGFQNEYSIDWAYPDDKKLWVVTSKGDFMSFDQTSGKIDSVATISGLIDRFSKVDALVVKNQDLLIFSTFLGGVYTYSISSKQLKEFKLPQNYVKSGENTILLLDKKDRLWIGSSLIENGLLVFDFNTNTYVQEAIFNNSPNGVPKELFTSMHCDNKGIIWLGTDGNGLYRIDPETCENHNYRHDGLNKFSLSSNTVIGINEDSRQNLWVLTNYGDINILRRSPNPVLYHPGTLNNKPTRILSSFRASDGSLWIGTDGEGITKISTNGKVSQSLINIEGNKGFYIHSIREDRDHNIWVGTYRNGLWIYDTDEHRFIKKTLKNTNGLNVQDVRHIFRDSKDRIWVTADFGIYLYSNKETRLAYFESNSHGLIGTVSQSIVEDNEGAIWVAYNDGGLFKFQENQSQISASHFDAMDLSTNEPQQKKETNFFSMAFDGNETLWMVNEKGQLTHFNIKTLEYNSKRNEMIENGHFKSVLVENDNTLWLGSNHGIWRYHVKDSIAETFYKSDGFHNNSYLQRSAHKGSDGYLYFGGLNGLHYFKPDEIKKKPIRANLFIEEVEIPNGPITSIFPKKGSNTIDGLKLNYRQSSFSFRFLAIDNVLYPNFKYAYRLRGFDDTWVFPGRERIASYTNIPPGDYVFEVKAGVKNGKWNIGQKSIAVSIAPPIWKTAWAYLFYVFVLAGLIYGMVAWIRLRSKLQTEKLMHKHDKQIFDLKMSFFAKMSHEIQTPLTLILVPLDQMMMNALKSGNDLLLQRLRIISNNAKRLSRIVFELTSLRDKEMEKLYLKPSENNLVSHLKEIAGAFEEQAKFRDIDFKCSYPADMLLLYYDTHKMEHIIYNLLSNAFKFTPKEGTISMDIAIEEWERRIKISITDSGSGIPKEELDDIFQLFYQADSGKQKNGTGIGLALTKELVDLHGGTIEVKSNQKRGTCFIVYFPIDEKVTSKTPKDRERLNLQSANGNQVFDEIPAFEQKFDKTLLVVEDNYELQISLKDIFDSMYNVLLAENGQEGYEMSQKHQPNLIISDIMMPIMNGIEMVTLLQENKHTAHIPIILLTAKKEKKDKIIGLRSGALEYIGKPFSTTELIIKVNNILTRSDRLMAKYKNDMLNLPKKVGTRSQNDVFLENVVESIESRMGNPEFKLEELAEDLKMSYSALFRKFQSLTGKTLIDFVRSMRLKKAYLLISEANYGIAQAAFSVGFNDPKYFSKCFRKEFDKTPNTVRKEVKTVSNKIEAR